MVELYIDDQIVEFDNSSTIKITKENPRFGTRGSFSLDVSVPMNVEGNRAVLGNINRQDVKKQRVTRTARLIADNVVLLKGKAVVNNVTQDSVRLQLIGGNGEIGLLEEYEQTYIDEVVLPNVVKIDRDSGDSSIQINNADRYMLGHVGQYVFSPVWDETHERLMNETFSNVNLTSGVTRMFWTNQSKLAIQPNLVYVMELLLNHFGFALRNNEIEEFARHIYVANARGTKRIERMLPHWTLSEFVKEFQNFFNCTVVIDETTSEFDIVRNSDYSENIVNLTPVEEYESSIEESNGDKNVEYSNIVYSVSKSDFHKWDCIDENIRKSYQTVTYDTLNDILAAEVKSKKCFHHALADGMYIFTAADDNLPTQIDQFRPLLRTNDEEDKVKLKIVPVAQTTKQSTHVNIIRNGEVEVGDPIALWVSSLESPIEDVDGEHLRRLDLNDDDDYDDGDEGDVKTVEEAVNGDTTAEASKEDLLQVMFVDENAHYIDYEVDGDTVQMKVPLAYTDKAIVYAYEHAASSWSLSLNRCNANHYIGELFDMNYAINRNAEVVFSFLASRIPAIRSLFVINNKRYICKKMEVNVDSRGIDKMIKGTFVELS